MLRLTVRRSFKHAAVCTVLERFLNQTMNLSDCCPLLVGAFHLRLREINQSDS
jgi:hypothetical protein